MFQRFFQRTWRLTSEKICRSNDIPPGFRIVLVDTDGRVKRDDLLVRSGCFVHYPGSYKVWAFLEDAISNHVKDSECLDYEGAQLRDHRNKPVSSNFSLREVRDMPGAGGRYTKACQDNDDKIFGLEHDIEEALEIFDEDDRLADDQDKDLLLKALIHYVISRFDIDALEYVLDFYKAEIEKVRSDRG